MFATKRKSNQTKMLKYRHLNSAMKKINNIQNVCNSTLYKNGGEINAFKRVQT